MLSAIAGFTAGLVHVLSGPDHLAAVAPLTVESRRRPWTIGMLWGVGHTGGVWMVGAIALLLREFLPVDKLSSFSERIVGVTLVVIGLWGLRRALSGREHIHVHVHDGSVHAHAHLHDSEEAHESSGAHTHTHAAFAVGTLHGLAGSAHFLGVLPALAFSTTLAALSYILFFGVGSIIAMTGFSFVIGAVMSKYPAASGGAYKWSLTGFSSVAIMVGVVWLVM